MIWNCAFDEQGTKSIQGLTVGQKFDLICSGESVPIGQDNLRFEPKEPSQEPFFSKLQILAVKKLEPTQIELVVTSYLAEQNKSDDIILTDGQNKIEIPGLQWDVQSVVESPQATPYPPYGPQTMSVSWYYWLFIAVILLLLVYRSIISFKKYQTRKRIFEELQKFKTARTPYDELHTELRKLERNLQKISPTEFLIQLEKSYRLYLIRELGVPALEWSDKEIVREVRKQHRSIYSKVKNDLIDYFAEIRKVKKDLKLEDCEFLLKNCQKISDKISDLMDVKNQGSPV